MTYLGFKRALFGTPGRRIATLIVANGAFHAGALAIQYYIDHVAGSPGLSFVMLAFWMALGVLAALVTVISLGDTLLQRGFSERFLKDDLEALDRRLDLAERGLDPHLMDDDDDDDLLTTGDSSIRFGIYFMVLVAANLMVSNSIGDGFLDRYSHPGLAVVHMRSPDPAVRRQGLTMLTERLTFTATPAVTKVVLAALRDPDEGVKARAAFVIGTLAIEAGARPLATLATENEALTFTALIALGQIREPAARDALEAVADDDTVIKEPRALAMAAGLLKAKIIERLRHIYGQAKDDEITRAAAVWALGQLREPRLFEFAAKALEDEALVVRCAAAEALELMVIFEASQPLQDAFAAAKDPLARCPEVKVPVQEGGGTIFVVRHRNYQLALVRALSSTDDPRLLKWYVEHQEGLEQRTHTYMQKAWEDLRDKDRQGRLNHIKSRLHREKLLREAQAPASAAPGSTAPDP